MRTLLTMGTFDILHPGHIELLRLCRGEADRVIVGLNKDAFVERFKGARPILTYAEREECLLACRYVDGVVPNLQGEDASACIEMVRPDILAVGGEWSPENYMPQLGKRAELLIKSLELRVLYFPRAQPPKLSSTIIKRRVLQEYAATLREALAN